MNSFSELSLSPALARNLATAGFQTPTPIQAQSIPPALEGRDIVATAQTGTGKTLAFLLPTLNRIAGESSPRGVQALILTPTRELALQIQNEFRKLAPGTGIRSAVAVGGLNENPQIAAVRQGAQVLIATPGRLTDFLQRRLVKLDTVRALILDEADRMLDMGFLPALEQILTFLPATRQTLLFSATIEKAVAHLVEKHVSDPVRIAIGSTRAPAEGVNLRAYEVEHAAKVDLLSALLGSEAGSFLVFSRTKHGADRLAKRLSTSGVKAAAIHGDRSQNQRNQALRGFQDGYYRVLVATDVAARGIHVDGVAHVVNFDLPQVPEDFIHRVGRTGRAGRAGIASSFHTPSERGDIRRIERALNLKLARPERPAFVAQTVVASELIPALEREVLDIAPRRANAPVATPRGRFAAARPKTEWKQRPEKNGKPRHDAPPAFAPKRRPAAGGGSSFREGFGFSNPADFSPRGKSHPKPHSRPFAKPHAKPEPAPRAKAQGLPFDKPFANGTAKPFAQSGKRPAAFHVKAQESPFDKPYGNRTAKPFAKPDAKPYATPNAKPFGKAKSWAGKTGAKPSSNSGGWRKFGAAR